MVLDNFPAHPHVELAFFSPNTASKTQFLDASVIHNLNFITIACLLVNNYKLQKVKIRNLNIAYCTVFLLIVVAINDQQNSELDKNEIMLKMCDNTKFKPIPTAKQAIQAIESLR